MSGQASNHLNSLSFKWPYQAQVMKMLDTTNSAIVRTPFIYLIIDNMNRTISHGSTEVMGSILTDAEERGLEYVSLRASMV